MWCRKNQGYLCIVLMAQTHQQATSQYGGFKTTTSDPSYLHEQQCGTGNQQSNSYSSTTQYVQGPVSTATETFKHYQQPYAADMHTYSNQQIAPNSQTVGHYQIGGNSANYQSSYSNATQHQVTNF